MFINVGLHGYGGEVVLGNVTKKAYEFWSSDDAQEHFSSYVWAPEYFSEENPNFKIPKFAELPTWYEIDSIIHESGAAWESCRIYIREMDAEGYDANEVREIYDGDLEDFIADNDIEVEWTDAHPQSDEYTFYGYSSEKGTFWEGTTEIPGDTFEPSKLRFYVADIYQDKLVFLVEYDGLDYLNNDGGGTDGKGSGFELIGPEDE